MEVKKGEIVSLIGSNGAGKTTLLNAITGLISPTEGNIYFENNNLNSLETHQITETGIASVPEGRRLFTDMTVLENLLLGAYTKRAASFEKESLLEVFSLFPILKSKKNQPAKTLSGGQQQMVALGRALMSKPKILLLDEPSLGLAPIITAEIFKLITRINLTGISILIVEQNVYSCLQFAHRGYILENGQITLSGDCANLMNNEHVKSAYLGV